MSTPPTEDTLCNTQLWFEAARPEPTRKDFNVQLGVHCEEVGEMLDEMSGQTPFCKNLIADANKAMKALASYLKTNANAVVIREENRINFLDAMVDQLVTATGSAQHLGMNPVGALGEVNRSNWSKFVDGKPIFDENGKIAKGPDYSKADLTPFV
jgi:predicted HAD superfamily Cof-like phosphohydrolase